MFKFKVKEVDSKVYEVNGERFLNKKGAVRSMFDSSMTVWKDKFHKNFFNSTIKLHDLKKIIREDPRMLLQILEELIEHDE